MLVGAIMRAVKRVNLDVATHAVTGGTLINQSIFCSPFFMNGRRPSLFRDRSRRPVSLHGSLFQQNKKARHIIIGYRDIAARRSIIKLFPTDYCSLVLHGFLRTH